MAGNDSCDGFFQLWKDANTVIAGESTDAAFEGAIEIDSFDFGSSTAFTHEDESTPLAKLAANRHLADETTPDQWLESSINEEDFTSYDLRDEEACQFQIKKGIDLSSAALFHAYCSGQHPEEMERFEKGVVHLRKSGTGMSPMVFVEFTFLDLIVAMYTLTARDEFPSETVKFSFAKCKMLYRMQLADGSLSKEALELGWDFLELQKW